VVEIRCSRCGKEFNQPMAELPADGFNLCDDCTKSLVSTFFLRLKANIRNWFSFGQKTN
jgi:DNA-directed RNA polymerase subunit RPC12/RpoP